MTKDTWDDKYNVRTVSTKLSPAEFSSFKAYCEKRGIKPSSQLKELIKKEIDEPFPVNIAGKNLFLYNKNTDSFSWRVVFDNGSKLDLVDNLSPEYVRQLIDSLNKVVEERNVYTKKEKKESVPIPSKIVRKKK